MGLCASRLGRPIAAAGRSSPASLNINPSDRPCNSNRIDAPSVLTYNSTIRSLVEDGTLVRWVASGPRRRELLASEDVAGWFNRLVSDPTAAGRQRNRLDAWRQVDSLLSAYVAGAPVGLLAAIGMDPPFKLMQPVRRNVWTLRTTDTRIFGWFVDPGLFVAVNASATDRLKQIPNPAPGSYRDHIARVTQWRDRHACSASALIWQGDLDDLLRTLR